MSASPDKSFTLKCKCSSFEAKFNSLPHATMNCHCHSCVAAIDHVESKETFDGISMKSEPKELGGVACAMYKSNNVEVVKVDKDSIGFVKVGENGKNHRLYCNKCGTVLFLLWMPNGCGVNRNALTDDADGKPFEEEGTLNVNCKYAFHLEKIPEPKHSMVTMGMIWKFLPIVTGVFADGSNKEVKELFPGEDSKVEVCPITWE